MANTVASQTLHDGPRRAVMKFTLLSDGTPADEAAALKVDVSTLSNVSLNQACTGVRIYNITYTVEKMDYVQVLWDADTDLLTWVLDGDAAGVADFERIGGLPNNAGSGKTGDIRFSTQGMLANGAYSIVLDMMKE